MAHAHAFRHARDRAPGTWRRSSTGGAVLACPTCGKPLAIGPGATIHEINPAGLITPSVVCPRACTFHAFVQLESWAS